MSQASRKMEQEWQRKQAEAVLGPPGGRAQRRMERAKAAKEMAKWPGPRGQEVVGIWMDDAGTREAAEKHILERRDKEEARRLRAELRVADAERVRSAGGGEQIRGGVRVVRPFGMQDMGWGGLALVAEMPAGDVDGEQVAGLGIYVMPHLDTDEPAVFDEGAVRELVGIMQGWLDRQRPAADAPVAEVDLVDKWG